MKPSAAPTFFKLVQLVNLTARPFSRLYEKRFGLKLSEWRVLFTISNAPGITASDVSDLLGIDKMAVSRAVSASERKGRLVRKNDSIDQRQALLYLTAAGRRLVGKIEPKGRARDSRLFSALTPAERTAFERSLAKLIERARELPD